MQFTIKVTQDLDLRGHNLRLGKNAQVHLNKASQPIICLLRYFFLTRPEAISGSRAALTFLFSFPGLPLDEEYHDIDDFIKRYAVRNAASPKRGRR